MKDIKNFKVNFSKILKEDYKLTKEEIGDFWKDKEYENKYNNAKYLIASIGAGAFAGTTAFTCVDISSGLDCVIPIAIGLGISTVVTGASLIKKNPYKELYSDELNDEYKNEYKKFKKQMKEEKKK